jgi:hypothetical protein
MGFLSGPAVPYISSGQQAGETRQAMTKTLMKDVDKIIDKFKNDTEKYYILFHAKPFPNHPNIIKIKPMKLNTKPPMMLSCLLFGVDNKLGKLTLEWALPGNWPTWAMEGANEPVPETIASIEKVGLQFYKDYDYLYAS